MTTIAYDRPVKDLISQLSATKHVTHKEYRKTSVTLHHNAGRLSHEGVLRVWQTRPASAQFDADALGEIAQFVKVNEYAWSAGNTEGNMRSIHIEMANSSLAPGWNVAEVTWKSAARLSGWLFAKVIGERPSSDNFFVHSHWYATACAGPYVGHMWTQIMVEAQAAYDVFKSSNAKPSFPLPASNPKQTPKPSLPKVPRFPLPPSWYFGPQSGPNESVSGIVSYKGALKPWQAQMAKRGWKITVDGEFGPETEKVVRQFQKEKRIMIDGRIGVQTWVCAWTLPVS